MKKTTNYKIVSLGGGTGLAAMLRGIKQYTDDITAIVSVADDGGGSGVLRQDLNMPPPGDIRSCLLALASVEPTMDRLLNYRFSSGSLSGQSFGNLFLAAMNGIYGGDFALAVHNMCRVLNITGRVYPVTAADVELVATLENGTTVVGESLIGKSVSNFNSSIKKVRLRSKSEKDFKNIEPLNETLSEIKKADIITIGPGSLYTSILPNLVIPKLADAIYNAKAPVVYINNIMTQPGETDNYTAFDHVDAILKHTKKDFIDYCIVDTSDITDNLLIQKYKDDGSEKVVYDSDRFKSANIRTIERNMITVDNNHHLRHNTNILADTIIDLITINNAQNDGTVVSQEGVKIYNLKRR